MDTDNSQLPTAQIMREKGLSRNTVNRWKSRTNSSDLSSARHTQTSSFASWQEALIVESAFSFYALPKTLPAKYSDPQMQIIALFLARLAMICNTFSILSRLSDSMPTALPASAIFCPVCASFS